MDFKEPHVPTGMRGRAEDPDKLTLLETLSKSIESSSAR